MVKLWSSLLALAAVALMVAGPVSASEGKKKHKRPTVEQVAKKIFTKLDTNKDNFLSLDEFSALRHFKGNKERAKKAYDKIHESKEGITLKEFTKWLKEEEAEHHEHHGKKHQK